jgi:cell division protein FtsL
MAELVLTRVTTERRKARPGRAQRRRAVLAALDNWIGWSGVLIAVVMLAIILTYVFWLVHVRSEVVQLGRQISALNDRLHQVELEEEAARLKFQALQNPQWLEKQAAALKLAAPQPDQVVVLGEK